MQAGSISAEYLGSEVARMAQVAEYKIGNTTIRIFDDACVKTQAEVDAILCRLNRLASRALTKPASGATPEQGDQAKPPTQRP